MDRRGHTIDRIVFTLHGIRTRGNWRMTFADVAMKKGWMCPLDGWSFGRFSLVQFLTPFARSSKVAWFRLSVSVRKGATFSVQLGPPQWLRVESFEEA
jgi:hypothetical protein